MYFLADDPVPGVLTVRDLENRSEAAYQLLRDTYAATTVLHDLYMATLDRDGPESPDLSLVTQAIDLIATVRDEYRRAWRAAYRAYADAVGVPPDDIPDQVPDGEVPGAGDGGQ